MKLSFLSLNGFRSFRNVEFDLDAPRVLFAGRNGSGKSTIRDSIKYALLGHCTGTDAKGAGAEVLIPEGERGANVTVTVDGIGPVSRTYLAKGGGAFAVLGFTGTSGAQHQALIDKLRTTPQFLEAVLDTDVFLDLGHADAKALILGLLNVRVPVGDRQHTLDELDALYRQAFEDRKDAKRALAAVRIPEVPAQAQPFLDAIRTQMQKLRTALGTAQNTAGTTVGRRQALQTELQREPVFGDVEDDLTAEITAAQESLAALEAAAVPAPVVITPRAMLEGTARALISHQPANGCIIDSRVKCWTNREEFDVALKAVQADLAAAGAPEPTQGVVSPLTAARQHLDRLQRRQAHRESTLREMERVRLRIAVVQQELDGLPDTAAAEAEIESLRVRIRKGEELLSLATTYWAAVDANERMTKVHAASTAEVARLEELVQVLGPNGARADALKAAMGRFQEAVNPYVKPFGWKISFSVEPWQVFANKRPVETYSRSERYRIGIALQIGIALLSGLKFVVVDELDMLDAENRKAVSTMLLEAPLDQAIILGTREPSQALPKVANTIVYRLESTKDGVSKVAERLVVPAA